MSDTKDNGGRSGSSSTIWKRHGDRILGAAAVAVLAIGTVAFHLLEGWSWVDSFYFSSIAASTVGFGDITPTTDASKMFTVFYVFTGITIITVWLNMRFKRHAASVGRMRQVAPVIDAPAALTTQPSEEPTGPGDIGPST